MGPHQRKADGQQSQTEHVHHLGECMDSSETSRTELLEPACELVRECSEAVLESWSQLRDILNTHGNRIQYLWMNKRNRRRREFLVEKFGQVIPMSHSPELEAVRADQHDSEGSLHAYSLPQINVEDLAEGNKMLLFLNARANSTPDRFAAADAALLHLGLAVGELQAPIIDSHALLLEYNEDMNPKTIRTYGRVVSFQDDAFSRSLLRINKNAFPFGLGLLTLGMQADLYDFLVKFCNRILPDPNNSASTAPSLTESQLLPQVEETASFREIADLAPYRPPMRLDLAQLEAIVAARRKAAEDHAWALREDPSYFINHLETLNNHRQDLIPIHSLVTVSAFAFEFWSSLHEQVRALLVLERNHVYEISDGKELPPEFKQAMLQLTHYLIQGGAGFTPTSIRIFQSSPRARKLFPGEPTSEDKSPRVTNEEHLTDPAPLDVVWTLGFLHSQLKEHTSPLLSPISKLHRLVEEDTNNNIFSEYSVHWVGETLTVFYCLHLIDLFRPWASWFREDIKQKEDLYSAKHIELMETLNKYHLLKFDDSQRLAAGNPSDGKFQYPVKEPRTEENLATIRRAEKSLDYFWDKLDYQLSEEQILSPFMRRFLANATMQRISEKSGDIVEQPLALYIHREEEEKKVKRITKATAGPTTTRPPFLPSISHLKPRSLKTFRALFYSGQEGYNSATVTRQNFIGAMTDMRFKAQRYFGSTWTFTLTDEQQMERRIDLELTRDVMSEDSKAPHMPYETARHVGRLLWRTFGWTWEMFQ